MAAQKKGRKRSYLNDFEKSQGGGYVYTGKTWHADKALRRRVLGKLWGLQAGMLFSALLPGFVTLFMMRKHSSISHLRWFTFMMGSASSMIRTCSLAHALASVTP